MVTQRAGSVQGATASLVCDLQNVRPNYLDALSRFTALQGHVGDLGDDIHAGHNLPKNSVLVVESRLGGQANEERSLSTVESFASGHRDHACDMLQLAKL